MTMEIDIQDNYVEAFFDFINSLPKDAVVVTRSSDEVSQKSTPSDSVISSKEEARISGVSYVSEQDYSADKDDFFKALSGN